MVGNVVMGETMLKNQVKTKKVKAFWWLLGITVAYFAMYYFLIIETKPCNPSTGGIAINEHWFYGFSDRYLACRQVNELGDALAGAFAPVAFLWLAGAVLIQSNELEAQREELNKTQNVMREQLKVARLQVDETKSSTMLFKKQTEILEREQKNREAKEADTAFDTIADSLRRSLGRPGEKFLTINSGSYEEYQEHKVWDMVETGDDALSVPAFLVAARRRIQKISSEVFNYKNQDRDALSASFTRDINLVVKRVEEISALQTRLSDSYRVIAEDCFLPLLMSDLLRLMDTVAEYNRKMQPLD